MSQPSLYLLDVEGTVAPCSLTSEQLIPYARTHFEGFLCQSIAALEKKGGDLVPGDLDSDSVFHDLALLHAENHADSDQKAPHIAPHRVSAGQRSDANPSDAIPNILAYLNWLMDRDSDSIALKSLQGKVWKAGFESGKLKGTLFNDVPHAFARWTSHARIAIYSSGSASAQQVFFSHTIYGDLTSLIAAYFDLRVGSKNQFASYAAIAASMQVAPHSVCFFSDAARELDAARAAGMDTRLICRPGNALVSGGGHSTIQSLDEVP
jgi:2,3-diketo-5-methylthio-1-phosphopentane phosphatase